MNQTVMIILAIVILGFLLCENRSESFYFRSPSLSYDSESCSRACDNTSGCDSFYYDPITRQCWMNSAYKYGELYYPYVNATYWYSPSRYRFGKYFGDIQGRYRPVIAKK